MILLVAAGVLAASMVGLLMEGAFGGGLSAHEVGDWVGAARALLVASIACCVLAAIARRWVLFSLSVATALLLAVMNHLQWNAGA